MAELTVKGQFTEGDNQGKFASIVLRYIPDHCPYCNKGIDVRVKGAWIHADSFEYGNIASVLFQCPKQNCRSTFVGYYESKDHPFARFRCTEIVGGNPILKEHSKLIIDSFPRYVGIYQQSEVGLSKKLEEIAGMGFRKALEFLVRDFLNLKNQESKEALESIGATKELGALLENFIESTRIKELAKRAAWLGNDEAHYFRRWEEKDVNDLILLVNLVEQYIDMDLTAEAAVKGMPKKA
jgi:hypothetical protein